MKQIRTVQGETISHIAWREYGVSSGTVELILEANPNLCQLPAILPMNTLIQLPDIQQATTQQTETINLWT